MADHIASRTSLTCPIDAQGRRAIRTAQWARRAIEVNRNFPLAHFWLAAALAQLGWPGEARQAIQPGLALAPGFTIARYRAGVQSDHPTYLTQREHIIEGMRMAGVPEG